MFRKYSVYAVAVLVTVALLGGCHGSFELRKEKYVGSGKRYQAERKFKEAAIQYSNAIRLDDAYAEAHYGLAQSYAQLGQLTAAYQELQRTVELQPANFPARLDLVSMLLAAGVVDEAQKQAQFVAAAKPDDASVHAIFSAIARQKGQNDLALAEIRRALELEPDRAAFHVDLALLLMEDSTQAATVEREVKRAIALNPTSMNARAVLIALYEKHRRWGEAEQAGRDAVSADPGSISARESLGNLLQREGKQTQAEELLRAAAQDLGATPNGSRLLADYYVNSGQAAKASTEFERLLEKYPKDVSIQHGYAWALLAANENAKAQLFITSLLKNHPGDPEDEALAGILQLGQGKAGEAVNSLLNAVKDAPKNAVLEFWLGKAALATGDMGLAERSFREAGRLNPSWFGARQELARLAALRADQKLLFEVANQTIIAFPNQAAGYIWRAITENGQNEPDKAEADLQVAMRLAPGDAAAYLQMGKLRFAQKRFPEGEEMLENALRRDPVSTEALRLLIARDLTRHRTDRALARLNQTVKAHPNSSNVYDLLARLQAHTGDLAQAALTAQKSVRVNPDDAEAVQLLADIEAKRQRIPDAIAGWERWLRMHPRDSSAMASIGALEDARGDRAKAEAYYKKCLQIQPTNPVAANNLAFLLLEQGRDLDLAFTAAQTARQALPDSPNTADTLAWAYYQKGIYGVARDLLEDAVRAAPDNATMHLHLGMVYARLSDSKRAAIHLKRAQSLARDTRIASKAAQALQALG